MKKNKRMLFQMIAGIMVIIGVAGIAILWNDKSKMAGKEISDIHVKNQNNLQYRFSEITREVDEIMEQKEIDTKVVSKEMSARSERLIVIDAGHQGQGDSQQEPIGPGASEQKARVSSGTTGISTGVPEYVLNLEIATLLDAELKNRGYRVLMVRTTHDVNMSNSERAAIANENHADAFIRIHANGSENNSAQGALTMCMTPDNPYNANLYTQSRKLSEQVLDQICAKTGAQKNNIIETDTMSGINWCAVPVTIVEMGYMSNPEEDQRLHNKEYQSQMVQGIADGVDAYFQ